MAPQRKGFGSTLVERLLAAELKDTVTIAYEKRGVVCIIEADMSKMSDEASSCMGKCDINDVDTYP
ncbi:two-component sensor histidine kinase [Neorhizobium galegae]|nr:two-component sensor histidine kinase [Neorhizobium galegae]